MNTGPGILVIFGATGDLTTGKLLPALNQWFEDSVPYSTVWCIGRRDMDDAAYRQFVENESGEPLQEPLGSRIRYLKLEFGTAADYERLRSRMAPQGVTDTPVTCYLAVMPESFVTITKLLASTGIIENGNPAHKLVFEKPFGKSLESAKEIQAEILKLLTEEQIYRIDHYLGKDMIRNILALRFGNRIFEESWNGRVLSSVRVISTETAGVEERLDYYDRAGAINDMIQSHLLQIVALVAMDAPLNFEAESIRQKKIEILSRLHPSAKEPPVVGQYEGYRQLEPQVASSHTETYVKAVLTLDLPEWAHTRFVLETGKKMGEKRMEIILEFAPKPMHITGGQGLKVAPNQLVIQVFPTEGVHVRFNSKAPGYDFKMVPVDADYCHTCSITGNLPEAYVKLLMDTEAGDKTLFAGCDEIEWQWRIADQLRQEAKKTTLWIYPVGTMAVTLQQDPASH